MEPDAYFAVGPDKMETGSELICLVCLTVLAAAMGSKTSHGKLRSLNYARALVVLLYFFSWAFAASSIILIATNNNNYVSCTLGLIACDAFYAGSKIIIYAWLIERVHLVAATNTTRFKSSQYKFHLALLSPFLVIFILMLTFRNINLEEDGTCIIGIQLIASIPLLVYDMLFNCYLTWLFIRPLLSSYGRTNAIGAKTPWAQSRLYKLTRRTLASSLVCLLVTFLNALSVVITKGHQRGLVCLTLCAIDVTVNVITVHWVTATTGSNQTRKGTVYDHSEENVHYTFPVNNNGPNNAIFPKPSQGMVFEHIDMEQDPSSHSVSNQHVAFPR